MFVMWMGFFLAIAVLMVLSRKSFWIALIISSVILGLFSLSPYEIADQIQNTLQDPSILLLALSVGFIPLIGGIMESTGLMDRIVDNLPIKQHSLLAFSSALMGMLPMPGGALLSAPVIKKGGEGVSDDRKSAINIWFRHLLLLIYPFGALLPTTKMAGINVYEQIVYLSPGFFLMLTLGYIFLLRDIKGRTPLGSKHHLRKIIIPLTVILVAPLIHILFLNFGPPVIPEIYLLCGVSVSLLFALYFGHGTIERLKKVTLKMRPWKYSLIIIGMFIFLNIFRASDTSNIFEALDVSKIFLLGIIGFFLGFVTGRVQLPVSILLPIYLVKYQTDLMSPIPFGIMFFSVYLGYVISPVHPCVVVSLEFFHTSFKDTIKHMVPSSLIGLGMVLLVGSLLGL